MNCRALSAVAVAVAVLVFSSGTQAAQGTATAADWVKYAEGQLSEAEFTSALKALGRAVRLEPKDESIATQYAVLRQVIRLRSVLPTQTNPAKREQMTAAMRAFYYDHRIFAEALELDLGTFSELATSRSAANLAESYLELDQHASVLAMFAEWPVEMITPRTRTLHALAIARSGDRARARTMAGQLAPVAAETPARLLFEQARLYARLENAERASELLAESFRRTRPSLLDKAHRRAQLSADLTPLTQSGEMKQLLAVKSEVAESSCSGGTSCGTCASASTCSTADDGEKSEKATGSEEDQKDG